MLQIYRKNIPAYLDPPKKWFVLWGAFFLFFYVFLKNAWVSEDAYIIFRSIEQLFAGNGPCWNPHERVQVFTSPLWYGVLVVFRLVSSDVFLNAIIASTIVGFLFFTVMVANNHQPIRLLFGVLLLLGSSAFFDYTTSGLENSLAFLLISVYHMLFQKLSLAAPQALHKKKLFLFLVCFGFILLCRHDLLTLVIIPTIYIYYRYRTKLNPRTRLYYFLVAGLPIFIWSLFALIYYGSLFPNAFYAKFPSNLDQIYLIKRGVNYFLVSLGNDTLTPLLIGLTLLYSWISRQRSLKILSLGILMNLGYIVFIGGDFMQGRFLSYPYLLSVMILITSPIWEIAGVKRGNSRRLDKQKKQVKYGIALLLVTLLLYLLFYPRTPVNTPWNYENKISVRGVDDERGYYFATSSLWQYMLNQSNLPFPNHIWSKLGYEFRKSSKKVCVMPAIGYFGYWAGTEKIIVDPLGIGDPFLARLPYSRLYGAVGHFYRKLPAGYQKSLFEDTANLQDPSLNAYYKRMRTVVKQKNLFTFDRIKTILWLNLGVYDKKLHVAYEEEPPHE